jgi:PAS domain S-box-containing protein
VIAINARTSELFGITMERALGVRASEYYANPIERAQLADRVRRDGRADNLRIELRHPAGGTFWALASSRLITVDGQLCIFTVFSDVTEQMAAEERLRASERRLAESEARARLVVNTAHDAFVGLNSAGSIVEWNARAEQTFGWTREEAVGRTLTDTIIPVSFRDAHLDGMRRFHATGEAPIVNKRLELVALHRHGHEFPVEITITSPVKEGDGYFFGAFLRDISDRREHDAQLRLTKEAAEAATRAKSEFLANMSHELRTPLNGVLGYAQLLRRDKHLTEDQREAVDAIAKGGAHLLDLITDVLDLSKIEAGRVDIETHVTNLTELAVDLEHLVAESASRKGLTLTLSVLPDTPRRVIVDGRHLRQVLLNLVGNAIKFTSRGEVRLTVAPADDDRLQFDVWDTGPGIEPESIAAIFEAFTQTKSGAAAGGTGLGLTISQRLLAMMGSELRVESAVGEGSRFFFLLPYGSAPPSAAADEARADALVDARLADGEEVLALVADDSTVNRRILAKLLESAGVRVITAAGGLEAVQLTRKHRPNIVFMDLKMPDLDGLEATRQLRADAHTSAIPVIAVTASAFGDTRTAARAVGCNDYLPKPVRADALWTVLRDHLGVTLVTDAPAPPPDVTTAWPHDNTRSATAARLRDAVLVGAIADIEALAHDLSRGAPHEQLLGQRVAQLAASFDFDELRRVADALMVGIRR